MLFEEDGGMVLEFAWGSAVRLLLDCTRLNLMVGYLRPLMWRSMESMKVSGIMPFSHSSDHVIEVAMGASQGSCSGS